MCKQRKIDLKMLVYNILPNSNEQITVNSYEYISEYLSMNFPEAILCRSNSLCIDFFD